LIFIEQERMYGNKGEVADDPDFTIPLGVADIKRPGDDLTILCWSKMVKLCLKAAAELEQQDISAEVIDLRTLRPLDMESILTSIRKTHRCLIVDEDWSYGGMGDAIRAQLYEHAFDDLDAPIARVCSEDVPVPFSHVLEAAMQPSVEKIGAKALEMVG